MRLFKTGAAKKRKSGASAATGAAAGAVTVKDYGAKGDGKTNDTPAIQKALDTGFNVAIPDGVYMIDVEKCLYPKSNQTITLSSGATLKAIATATAGTTAVFRINGLKNTAITGGVLYGEREGHAGTSGEWGMGIIIAAAASAITVSGMTFRNFWGDGMIIGNDTLAPVSNITVSGVRCENNRRQGISICNADTVSIVNCIMENTKGTEPGDGIDIEPEAGQSVTNVKLDTVKCYGNNGNGLEICGCKGAIRNITVTDCAFYNNVKAGIAAHGVENLNCVNTKVYQNSWGILTNKESGSAKYKNVSAYNNQYFGAAFIGNDLTGGIKDVEFSGSSFFNNSQRARNQYDGVVIVNHESTGYIKNISFLNCKFYDDQAAATQRYGLNVVPSATISGIYYDKKCTFSKNISGGFNNK